MANTTLYELLGVSRERADEIAKEVFHISKENAEIFACGWFAGKYAGVSEVFNVVQREMEISHLPLDGYA